MKFESTSQTTRILHIVEIKCIYIYIVYIYCIIVLYNVYVYILVVDKRDCKYVSKGMVDAFRKQTYSKGVLHVSLSLM